jgi:hypothetical protein
MPFLIRAQKPDWDGIPSRRCEVSSPLTCIYPSSGKACRRVPILAATPLALCLEPELDQSADRLRACDLILSCPILDGGDHFPRYPNRQVRIAAPTRWAAPSMFFW